MWNFRFLLHGLHIVMVCGEMITQGAEILPKGEQCPADAAVLRDSAAINGREDIIGFEALWTSMMKCKRGVMWKDSVAGFFLNGVKEVSRLSDELESGTYRERRHQYFTITSPKRREIMSISFRDRVYQRSLNDVAIYPEMVKHFIYDNGACQTGKGTSFARNRMKCHLQRFYRKHGTNGYILKMDVKGYYPNMRHDVAKEVFRRYLPEDVYRMAETILDGFPGDVGFNPGSQIIQIAGISVLNGIDHFIKERLRIKHYIRYMDDMIAISDSMEELETVREAVREKLAEIGFELHPDKTRIIPISEGILFLGFHYRLTETGKVLMSVDSVRVKAERRKLRRMASRVKKGLMTREKVDQCFGSWIAHAKQGNSWKLIRRMELFYQSLWEVTNDHDQDHSRQNCETPAGV